ncbi:ead/Ea22-like family protein [Enterobacter kobei]|uniref:ead/Ea22-like family protein n=1 Tax=Enterobacter kobei TaxID=208224 RepID=UPI001FD5BDD0|nr:ead/Ea22-like family protein [Enterobacter kobei]MDE7915405.1 ead/Ea22-like family protein [Enterobacter kobei]
MSNIDKHALREAAEKASTDNHTQDEWFHYLRCSNPETVLALLDEIAELEQGHCGAALLEREESHAKTVGKLLDELEAAEKRIAELRELLQWAHDTLLEINPNNYTHDDVCEINSASVEVILGIAPVLGETHGKSEEWWAARAAGTAKGE